jgi:hypothetical protein
MAVILSALAGAGQQFFDNNGNPLSGGKLYTYAAGTTTPQATYTSANGLTAHTNPIVLDSAGRVATGEIWVTVGQNYKFVLKTSAEVTIATWDNITGINGTGIPSNATNVEYDPPFTGALTSGYTVANKLSQTVSVKDFGAVGDGVADDAAAIQAAIDYAVYTSKQAVYVPAGRYKISTTLQLGYGTNFRQVMFYGDGKPYLGESTFSGTTIFGTFSDAPLLAVNGGRGTTIQGMTLLGLNRTWIENRDLGGLAPTLDDLVVSNWVDPTLNANANSRYAPYCAIAIDPYSGTAPSPAYPNNTYGKSASSETNIQNVDITGFVVGVAIKPSNADGNADYTRLTDCAFFCNVYGVSVGNTQSRLVGLTNTNIVRSYAALTTNVNGLQNGRGAFTVINCEIGSTIKILQAQSQQGGPCTFTGCYGEVLYSIGSYRSSGASAEPIVFTGCSFNFGGQAARGTPLYLLDADNTDVVFNGMAINGGMGVANFAGQLFLNDVNLQFDSTSEYTGTVPLYIAQALNTTGGITSSSVVYSGGSNTNIRLNGGKNLTTGAEVGVLRIVAMNQPVNRTTALSLWTKTMSPSGASNAVINARFGEASGIFNSSDFSVSQSGKEVTLVKSAALSANQYNYFGLNPGDIVRHDATNTIFFIRSRVTETIIMVAQNNYNSAGNLLQSITGGNFYFYCGRMYGSANTLLATATATSAILTAVGQSDGSSVNDVLVDDAIYINQKFNYLCNPAHTVTNVNTGARTMTLSAVAAPTGTFNLGPFIAKAPPNV